MRFDKNKEKIKKIYKKKYKELTGMAKFFKILNAILTKIWFLPCLFGIVYGTYIIFSGNLDSGFIMYMVSSFITTILGVITAIIYAILRFGFMQKYINNVTYETVEMTDDEFAYIIEKIEGRRPDANDSLITSYYVYKTKYSDIIKMEFDKEELLFRITCNKYKIQRWNDKKCVSLLINEKIFENSYIVFCDYYKYMEHRHQELERLSGVKIVDAKLTTPPKVLIDKIFD